jgi:iron complex outermembrane receptor protein
MRTIFKLTTSLAVMAAVQSVAPASAAANAADTNTATDPAVESPAEGIKDIVVTATKRETNLQRTPISMSVIGTETIKDRHIQSLYDLADGAIPSLRVATFEARQTALTIGIRGIVPLDANQPAREQGVGVYIDGVYLGRSHGLNAGLFDIERVEVLKGPQGTLFGRNTEGGALSLVSKAPRASSRAAFLAASAITAPTPARSTWTCPNITTSRSSWTAWSSIRVPPPRTRCRASMAGTIMTVAAAASPCAGSPSKA